MQRISKISLLTLVLLNFSTYPMCVNNGSMVSYDCNINFGQLINNGVIKGINSIRLAASYLSGTGTIESPDIIITCNEFKFSGSISCDKQCTIYAKKDFDTNMFKRSGNGAFKVIISPYDVKHFNRNDLCLAYYRYFCSNCLGLDQNTIDNNIKEIRTQAALNSIEDKAALTNINNYLRIQANFYREKLGEKYDSDSLYSGLVKCCVGVLGLNIAYALSKAEWEFPAFASVLLAGASVALSCLDFYNGINPRYKEKHDAFSLIASRIDHALKTERIPEEKIITLK